MLLMSQIPTELTLEISLQIPLHPSKRKVYPLDNNYFPGFQMRNIAKVNLWDRMKNKIGEFECQ